VRRNFDLEKRISLLDADNLSGVVDVVAADGDVAAFEMWHFLLLHVDKGVSKKF